MNAVRYKTIQMLQETACMFRVISATCQVGVDPGKYVTYVYMCDRMEHTRYTLLTIYTDSHCYFSSSGKVGKHPWRHL